MLPVSPSASYRVGNNGSSRALVGEPEIVLLDEPTSSSDLRSHELLHLLADLNQQGLTILLSTHDLGSYTCPGLSASTTA